MKDFLEMGGDPTLAGLAQPHGLSRNLETDSLYISEEGNDRIRKIYVEDFSYVIDTIAGGFQSNPLGSDVPATSGSLTTPAQIWAVTTGDVYFTEHIGNVRRLVPLAGGTAVQYTAYTIMSFEKNIAGICLDSAGYIYLTLVNDNLLIGINQDLDTIEIAGSSGIAGYSGDGGSATSSKFNFPLHVACVESSVYVADFGNGRVRMLFMEPTGMPSFSPSHLSTKSPSLTPTLNPSFNPTQSGIPTDSPTSWSISPSSFKVNTVVGGGSAIPDDGNTAATSVALSGPSGVWVSGNLTIKVLIFLW